MRKNHDHLLLTWNRQVYVSTMSGWKDISKYQREAIATAWPRSMEATLKLPLAHIKPEHCWFLAIFHNSLFVIPNVKYGSGEVMIWAYFAFMGSGQVGSQDYVKCEAPHPTAAVWPKLILQQETDSKHRNKSAAE